MLDNCNGDSSICELIVSTFFDIAKVGVDIRLESADDCLVGLTVCTRCAFRLEAEVLVGGGVCIELAERIDVSVSWTRPIFNGVEACFEPLPLVDEEDEGLGDEESWRDSSTGGNERLGCGDGWCT